jgi:hypothetical protein
MNSPDLDRRLRAADPYQAADLQGADVDLMEQILRQPPVDPAVLVAARRTRRRRVGVRRALAVAAVAALLPIGRIALDTADPAGASVAIAADGSLQCSGEGYAAPIDPRNADLRLLPASLPDGWQLDTIAARWQTINDTATCWVPALSLTRVDADRVVAGNVSVFGPFDEVDMESYSGDRTSVEVAGEQGLLLDGSVEGFQRWVWTAGDRIWVMEALELTGAEGELLAAGITTTGNDAGWQPAGDDADLQVVTQRAGPLPTYRPARLAWYVDLTGPDGLAAHYTVDYQPEHPTPALEAAWPGSVVSPDGTEARMEQLTPGEGEDQINVWRDGLRISAGAGPIFGTDTGTPAPVPFADLSAIVDSLTPVPADDPRLTEHALDEDTVEHP